MTWWCRDDTLAHASERLLIWQAYDGGTGELEDQFALEPDRRVERPLGGRFVRITDDDEFGHLWTSLVTSERRPPAPPAVR